MKTWKKKHWLTVLNFIDFNDKSVFLLCKNLKKTQITPNNLFNDWWVAGKDQITPTINSNIFSTQGQNNNLTIVIHSKLYIVRQ